MIFLLFSLLAATPHPEAVRLAQEGALAAQRGSLGEARVSFEAAHRLAPDDATIVYNLAQLREAQGDLPGARVAYERYLFLAPSAPDARAVRSHLATLAAPATAQAGTQALTGVASGRSPTRGLAGAAAETMAAARNADAAKQEAAAASGTQPTYAEERRPAAAPAPSREEAVAQTAVTPAAVTPAAAPATVVPASATRPAPAAEEATPATGGVAAGAAGPSAEMEEKARRAVMKGDAYLDFKRLGDAEAEYIKATEALPGSPELHLKLANVYERQEKYAEATASLRRYAQLVSGDDRAAAERRMASLEIKADDLRSKSQHRNPADSVRASPTMGPVRQGTGGVISRGRPDVGPASDEASAPLVHFNLTGQALLNTYNGRAAFGVATRVEMPILAEPGSLYWFTAGVGGGLLAEATWMHFPFEVFGGVRLRPIPLLTVALRAGLVTRVSTASNRPVALGAAFVAGVEAQISYFSIGVDFWALEGVRPLLKIGFGF